MNDFMVVTTIGRPGSVDDCERVSPEEDDIMGHLGRDGHREKGGSVRFQHG